MKGMETSKHMVEKIPVASGKCNRPRKSQLSYTVAVVPYRFIHSFSTPAVTRADRARRCITSESYPIQWLQDRTSITYMWPKQY